ncbi:MAG: hypothetical protein Q8L86_04805 [Vicinamibacterales bacterium]|nr:hypothetical protein [Vicinamibacterales bacterium]
MADNTAIRLRHIGSLLFLLTAAFVLAKTGRDALYFQRDGIRDLPLAYGGIALTALPMAVALLAAVRRFGTSATRATMLLMMAGALAVVAWAARPGAGPGMTLFFVLIPVAFGAAFSLAWLLVAETIGRTGPQLAAAYSRAGAASIAGGIGGAALARVLSASVSPQSLLLLAGLGVLAAVAVIRRTERRFPGPPLPTPTGPVVTGSATRAALSQPYVRLLLGITALAAIGGVLIEFQFYWHVSSLEAGDEGPSARFANLYLGLNLAAFVLQLTAGARLQRRIGVAGALAVLPLVITGLLPIVIGLAAGAAFAALRLAEGGLKASLYRVGWEQVYLLVGDRCRTEARLVVDGMGIRAAEGGAALLLYAGMQTPDALARWLPWGLLVLALLWVALVARLRPYLASAAATGDATGAPLTRIPDS